MKRLCTLAVLLIGVPLHAQKTLDDGIKELATQITASATKQEKQRIAVLPFRELDGQPTVLGTYLAEELVTNLFQLGNFKIVERQLLDKVMGELRVQRSGAIDPTTAKEIGRIAAVDAIVTGSITELENLVAVNCRLIETTTGEVFGAAQTKIRKDDDVAKIINKVLTADNPPATGGRATHETAKAIATRDIGSVRVVLKSVSPVNIVGSHGETVQGLRWTLELNNRESRRPVVVALNAETGQREPEGLSFGPPRTSKGLRASVLDDRGYVWKLTSDSLGSIGFVQAGVYGRNGSEVYSPSEIARLLRLRDELGRETDDPSDGTMSTATSMGEGGSNIVFNTGGPPPQPRFFAFRGNRFVSGSTTEIGPGESRTVTLDFRREGGSTRASAASSVQFNGEIVVGVAESGRLRTYSLHTLTFDRVVLPPS